MWRSAQLGLDSQASDHDLITQRTGGHARTRRPAWGALSGPAWRVCGPEQRRAGRTCTGHPGPARGIPAAKQPARPGPSARRQGPSRCSLRPHLEKGTWPCQARPLLHTGSVSPVAAHTPTRWGAAGAPPPSPREGRPPTLAFLEFPNQHFLASHPTPPAYTPPPAQHHSAPHPLHPPRYPATWSPGHSPPAPASQGWDKGPPHPGHKEKTQLTVGRGSAFLTCIWGMRAAARR